MCCEPRALGGWRAGCAIAAALVSLLAPVDGGAMGPTEEPTTGEPITEEPITAKPTTEEPPAEKPTTEEPPTEEPPTEEPIAAKPIAEGDSGILVGFDLGLGFPAGGSDAFSTGIGRSFTVGYRYGLWSLEWRVGEHYDLGLDFDTDARVDASLQASSLVVSRLFDFGIVLPFVTGGASTVSAPILVMRSNGRYNADSRRGVGLAASVGVLVYLGRGLFVNAELRSHIVRWERVGATIVTHVDDDGSYTSGVDPDGGMPISLNLGLRIFL